jgi:hypothetical protein
MKPARNRHFLIHYYASSLLAGDISFGVEHRFKKRFGQELSFNLKMFQPKFYDFDKGHRADYLIKYYLYDGKVVRFSANLNFEYKNNYFHDRPIDYYYIRETNQHPKVLYQTLTEDRRHCEYGIGAGFSLNLRLYKRFSAGGDLGVNFVKYKVTNNYREILYREPYRLNLNDLTVPSTNRKDGTAYSPLIRIKLSYSI